MPTLPINAWSAESLRLTVFPTSNGASRSPDWWQLATGNEPGDITTNPKRGIVAAEGPFHQGKLAFRSMLDRMDWLFVPPDNSAEVLFMRSEVPTLGSLVEAIRAFSESMERWLKTADLPEVARIAFGGTVVHPMDDRKEAYLQLRDYIPVRIDPDSTDILYQINLPTLGSKTIEGIGFNRLSKWFVGNYSVMGFSIVQNMGGPIMQTSPELALRVELDVNTVPSLQGIIPKDRLVEVFRELVAIGQSIVADGVGKIDQ